MDHCPWIMDNGQGGVAMTSSTAVREFSAAVFGNKYVLEVAAAAAAFEDGVFTQTNLAGATGLDRNLVALVVKRLEAAGLVKRLSDDGRSVPMERQDSPFWNHCTELLAWLSP